MTERAGLCAASPVVVVWVIMALEALVANILNMLISQRYYCYVFIDGNANGSRCAVKRVAKK